MWKNEKYKGFFKGSYTKAQVKTKAGFIYDRVFTLSNIETKKVVSFESFQAARKAGWVKVA